MIVVTFVFKVDELWQETFIYELPRGKTNNVVSDQVRLKLTCTVTEKS